MASNSYSLEYRLPRYGSLVASYRRCARPGMGSSLDGELRKKEGVLMFDSRMSQELKAVDPLEKIVEKVVERWP